MACLGVCCVSVTVTGGERRVFSSIILIGWTVNHDQKRHKVMKLIPLKMHRTVLYCTAPDNIALQYTALH